MAIPLEHLRDKGKKLLLEPEKTVATEEKVTGSSPLKDPPNILMFRRKAIRVFPDGKRVALYYSPVVDKTLALPYGGEASHDINLLNIKESSEEKNKSSTSKKTEKNPEAKKNEKRKDELTGVLGRIQKVATDPDLNGMPLKFKDGSSAHVNKMTAIAIMNVHGRMQDLNKANLHKHINKSNHHFEKIAAFAHGYHSDRDIEGKNIE